MTAETSSPTASLAALAALADREAAAAVHLTELLRQGRTAVEERDATGLYAVLESARRAAEDLARAGGERLKGVAAAARDLGLPRDSKLAAVAGGAGEAAEEATTRLDRSLGDLARESATLGICVRYSAVASERMLNLHRALSGSHAGYAADGRLHGNRMRRGRQA